jgi:hypothetical protein
MAQKAQANGWGLLLDIYCPMSYKLKIQTIRDTGPEDH